MADRIQVAGISFVGEQDGVPEGQLKQALETVFPQFRQIKRAYLARVRFTESKDASVAVCICGKAANSEIMDACGLEFQRLFNRSQYLDILFLTAAQDRDVSRVCQPFYARPTLLARLFDRA